MDTKTTTLEEFYKERETFTGKTLQELLPPGINQEVGHFNVFNIAETLDKYKKKDVMPYNRRAYYKISLIRGRNTAEYADKVIDIEKNALLFATPKIPYHWIPKDPDQNGFFCVFTDEFILFITFRKVLCDCFVKLSESGFEIKVFCVSIKHFVF